MRRRTFLLAALLAGCGPAAPRPTPSPESRMKMVTHEGVHIATQAFGVPTDPTLVMVMGATASMLSWPDELCEGLAAGGLHVIRFDHRDTGGSTTLPLGEARYAVEDMGGDVLAILDAYGVDRAHLMGMSLGAYISQMLAVSARDRVRSLTLVAAEPLGWDGPPLPHISEAFMAHFGKLQTLDWSNTAAVEAFLLEIDRLSAGAGLMFDADRSRARIRADLARSPSPSSMFNHSTVETSGDWTDAFRRIDQPVLVIHGELDPVLPLPNARAIASGAPNATLHVLEGVGHELPLPRIPEIVEQVVAHVRAAETRQPSVAEAVAPGEKTVQER